MTEEANNQSGQQERLPMTIQSLISKLFLIAALLAALRLVPVHAEEGAPQAPAAAATEEALTNASIIQMVSEGVGEASIIRLIRASTGSKFDVGAKGLVELAKAKVPESVQIAMQDAMTPAAKTSTVQPARPGGQSNKREIEETSELPRSVGIYLFQDGKYTKLPKEAATIRSDGGMFGGSSKALLSGANSRLTIRNSQPIFYMRFATEESLSTKDTPQEFQLAILEVRERNGVFERRVVTSKASANPVGGKVVHGVPTKSRILVDEEEIEQGYYKVVPQSELPAGEYAFVRVGDGYASSTGTLFTFSVRPAE